MELERKNSEKELVELEELLKFPKCDIEIGKTFFKFIPVIVAMCSLLGLSAFLSDYFNRGPINLDALKIPLDIAGGVGAASSFFGSVYYFRGKREYNKIRQEYYKKTLFPDYFLN